MVCNHKFTIINANQNLRFPNVSFVLLLHELQKPF